MSSIWLQVDGNDHIKPLMAKIYRLVESQEQIATLNLVNNVYEQGILEDIIEATKKPFPKDTATLHYLLKTPFRYPPLKHGSRFGTANQPSLFYGSLTITTALAETAYYRFIYLQGLEIPFSSTLASEYTSFAVSVRSKQGIFLDQQPFSDFQSILTSPTSYSETQQLGQEMRQNQVEIVQYVSARDKNKGKNIALFTPNTFHSTKPLDLEQWLCQTNRNEIGFLSQKNQRKELYRREDFCVDGLLPLPAI